MNLHEVRLVGIQAVAWMYPVGGNGRILTPTYRGSWNAIGHAYLISRGTPPPDEWSRQWWIPWGSNYTNPNFGADPLQPLCGRINSQAKKATLRGFGQGMLPERQCPECRELAPNATFINTLNVNDPWFPIPTIDRRTTRDPITGL